jgi:hypothetical protein
MDFIKNVDWSRKGIVKLVVNWVVDSVKATLATAAPFFSSLSYTEPWLWALAVFHLIVMALIVLARDSEFGSLVMLAVVVATSLNLRSLNNWAIRHAASFSKHPEVWTDNGYAVFWLVGVPMLAAGLLACCLLFVRVTREMLAMRRLRKASPPTAEAPVASRHAKEEDTDVADTVAE